MKLRVFSQRPQVYSARPRRRCAAGDNRLAINARLGNVMRQADSSLARDTTNKCY